MLKGQAVPIKATQPALVRQLSVRHDRTKQRPISCGLQRRLHGREASLSQLGDDGHLRDARPRSDSEHCSAQPPCTAAADGTRGPLDCSRLASAGAAALAGCSADPQRCASLRQRRPPSDICTRLPVANRPGHFAETVSVEERRLRKALAWRLRRCRLAAVSSCRTPTTSSPNRARASTRRSARSALTKDAQWPRSGTGSFTATVTAANTRSRMAR